VATFAYTARDRSGHLVRGRQRAANEAELRKTLKGEGVLLVKSKRGGSAGGAASARKVSAKELILFTFNLHNLLDSGVPMIAGMTDMQEEIRDARFRAVVADVVDAVLGGETFAQALRHHPGVFDPLYVNMCEAGEQSGRLPHVLERLVQFLEWREEFKRRIRELVTYPIVVLAALIGLIALVIGFVFPRFSGVFERLDFELPWSTRVLLGASDFLTSWWLLLMAAGVALWVGTVLLNRVPRVRLVSDTIWLRVPIVGELVSMLNFGQVANSLSSFLDSGIPIPRALEMVERMVPNRRVAVSVREVREAILAGETMSAALRSAKIFPPLVIRMVSMGEQSGRLVDALEKAARIYDREIPQRTKRVLDLLNPVMTMIMGGMLLFVILSVMTPLYRMYQQIGTSY
jgi:type IV pilus assembly protein PilC